MSDPTDRPIFRQIVVDLRKLRDYCLSPSHPRGRHKAQVFISRLGLRAADAEVLQEALISAVLNNSDKLAAVKADQHGKYYTLNFKMSTAAGTGTIRSIWLMPAESDVLRLVTCYVR